MTPRRPIHESDRPHNACDAVARFIAGDTTICGFDRCESCPANRNRVKRRRVPRV